MISTLALSRGQAFAILAAACALLAASYVGWAAARGGAGQAGASDADELAAVRAGPHLLFRSATIGASFGRLSAAALAAEPAERAATGLRCDRLYFAAGHGICLAEFSGTLLGPDLQPTHTFSLGGYASRARVSPDGRYAATTVFVSGHSYMESGFSTETNVIDTASGQVIDTLENFAVFRDGARFHAIDFNFWGVTFARDSNQFYATLATQGATYLVEGDLAARTMRVLHQNVECPSLSPDNTRVAYKKLVRHGANLGWRLHVLDLATMAETSLAEARSVDDQVEWLDNATLLYALPEPGASANVWAVPADGSGQPAVYAPGAASPVVVR